jgi:hypothetical protein
MLQFFVAEPDQRLQRDLIAEPVLVAQFKDLGIDEALDQSKHIGIGPALNLTDEALFIGGQRGECVGHRQRVGEKFVGGIETAPPDHVLVDVPADSLGRLNAACVPFAAPTNPGW